METKINIAEILKDKPENTKLYSPIFGDTYFSDIENNIINVKHHGFIIKFYSNGKYYSYYNSEPLLFPSKEMRDWSKFAWKKGDVLVGVGQRIIFEKFIDENYTRFQGRYSLSTYEDETLVADKRYYTSNFRKLDDSGNVENYFKELEEKLGGKLNRETLEIEKKPEFKDGDIVVTDPVPSMCYSKCIFILKGGLNAYESRASSYVFYNINNNHISFDIVDRTIRDRNIHLATAEEKLELFDALIKEGKYWDAEKKQIVDLSKKCEFKPFDKVLGRNTEDGIWEAEIFSHYEEGSQYPFRCVGYSRKYCIPYNENTKHLLGTTNNLNKYEG